MKRSSLKFTLAFLSLATLLLSGFAQAQLGISPSMNSQFLTELRARSPKYANEGRDVLGADRQKLDEGRALSRPELFSLTNQYTQRLSADITGFNSQYQMGRKYLSPFYHGVLALEEDASDTSAFKSHFDLQQTFEYNSAVNFGKGGFILSPMLLADVSYQISPNQSLSFKGGIGLSWISDNDGVYGSDFTNEFFLNVLPGTSLAYDLELGALHVTVYDRVSVKPRVGMLQNDAGIAGTLALTDQLSWTVNYNFSKTYDIDGRQGFYDAAGSFVREYAGGYDADIHSVSSMIAFESKGSWSAGLEGALNWYEPDNPAEANNGIFNGIPIGGAFFQRVIIPQAKPAFIASAGTFVQLMVNKNIRLRVAAGFQYQSFSGPFQNLQRVNFETSQPYYSVSLSQKINDQTSQELSAGYETNLQRALNNVSSHFVNYGITRQVWKGGQLTGSAYFEYSDSIETIFAQNNTSYGFDLHLSQHLTEKLSAFVSYGYSNIDYKNLGNFFWDTLTENYTQHMAGFSLAYAFSAKTQAQLGWQGFYNDGDFQSSLDYHRVR
ncbi:MAG: hypothetical protein NTV80_02555 [Verrucomicrobia bacterium]|nr:hypothetical protein [Verrucomicrobiota bacterium]